LEKTSVDSILEKWSGKYKRSIDCSNPKGFSQRAHCAGRRKRKRGGKTKSRPVESFTENTMENLSEFFINEVNQAVKKEMTKTKLKETSKDLFEAVNLHTKLKKENAPEKKVELAERAVELAELKVLEGYDELNERCDCGEGEGRMLKGQLLTLMANADKLYHMISEEDQFEDWVQAKVTTAEDYINSVYSYLTYYNGEGEADESDWDDDGEWEDADGGNFEDWDEIDEEDFEVEDMSPAESIESAISNLEDALDSTVDDDELFDSQKRI
jgi:hypothetical protein